MIEHMPGRKPDTFVSRQPANVKAIVFDAHCKITGMDDKLTRHSGRDSERYLICTKWRADRYIGGANLFRQVNYFDPNKVRACVDLLFPDRLFKQVVTCRLQMRKPTKSPASGP